MDALEIEKFLFYNKCELHIFTPNFKKIEKQKSQFLFTLISLYFFGEHPSKNPDEFELEKNLICKIDHEKFYVFNYEDSTRQITFCSREEEFQLIMDMRELAPKDFKDFVTVCLIIDGYKIISQEMNKSYLYYLNDLFFILENILLNNGSLLIDDNFFNIELNLMSTLIYFLARIDKYVVNARLNDNSNAIIKLFLKIFCEEDSDRSINLYSISIEDNPPIFPKLYFLKVLHIKDNYLDDKGFELINQLFQHTEFLTELEISKNNISTISLIKLSEHFPKGLRMLEKLNLSNNWIQSFMLDEFVKNCLENLVRLNSLDLSNNLIDNDFIKKFEMNYLRKIYSKFDFNEVLIDLTNNRFDSHIMRKVFHLWRPEDEVGGPERGVYTLDNFLTNIATMKIKLKFKIDCIKHFKDLKDLEPWKRQLETKDYDPNKKHSENIKCLKIYTPTINPKFRAKDKEDKHEIQEYIDLFEFFYLADQFFDPNLNNFNVKDPSGNLNSSLGFLNNTNYNKLYNLLEGSIVQQIQSTNNFNSYSSNVNNMQILDNLHMIESHIYYNKKRDKIIQKLFNKDSKSFNPNNMIEHLNDFYKIINDSILEIPFMPIHRYINRVKIETVLALKDRDIYSIRFLSQICQIFRLSFMEVANLELISLEERSEIIIRGLKAVLNFEGNNIGHRYFLHEINNFFDIFIKEADSINLKNEVVYTAKYIQFIRNNNLRARFFKIYEDILKEENLFSGSDNISSEFDLIYKKYRDIHDFNILRIPDNVKNKNFSLHPFNWDYLLVSEVSFEDLEMDLKIVSEQLIEEESYGIRNIHDRIHFFFTSTSDKNLDQKNKFNLHKTNNFLKTARNLFRFFNNVDLFSLKNNHFIESIEISQRAEREKENNTNQDRNALLNYSKLKSLSDIDKRQGIEKTAKEIIDYKKKILAFDDSPMQESLLSIPDDFNSEDENGFNTIAFEMSIKLFQIFDGNISWNGNTISNISNICKNTQNFIQFFNETSKNLSKENPKQLELFNEEVVMQIYRQTNRNEFASELKVIQYNFGLLSILSYYLELNNKNFLTAFNKWMNYLISKNYYAEYCKHIQINLNSGCKIPWKLSLFEIENRLENPKEIILGIHFGKRSREEFKITENTKINDLFETILKESKYFRKVVEKRMYWIYVKHININESVPVFNEEYVLDLISYLELNYLNNYDQVMQARSGVVQTSYTYKEENLNDKVHNSKDIEIVFPSKDYKSFVFTHVKFIVQRRLYSPAVISGYYSLLHENEIYILFEQLKNHFIKQEFSIEVADGDTVNLCAVLLELLKRNSNEYNKSKNLEDYIEVNLYKTLPKYKKNIISNKLGNFIGKIHKTMIEKNLSIRSEISLKEEFLKILINYEIFYSNVYLVTVAKNGINLLDFVNLPEKFLIMTTLNYIAFLDSNRFEPILKFNYYEIIHCFYLNDTLHLAMIINNDGNITKELRLKIISDDPRFIMEDILSYSQIFLSTNTSSSLTNCKIQNSENEIIIDLKPALCDLKDYKLVYQRKLPFLRSVQYTADDKSLNSNIPVTKLNPDLNNLPDKNKSTSNPQISRHPSSQQYYKDKTGSFMDQDIDSINSNPKNNNNNNLNAKTKKNTSDSEGNKNHQGNLKKITNNPNNIPDKKRVSFSNNNQAKESNANDATDSNKNNIQPINSISSSPKSNATPNSNSELEISPEKKAVLNSKKRITDALNMLPKSLALKKN